MSKEPAQERPWTSRLALRGPRFSLLHLLGLAALFAVIAALLRYESARVIGLVGGGSAASVALAPLMIWLVTAIWKDLWLPFIQGRLSGWLAWFHWQRSQALFGLLILAILWAAIENELTHHASIRASIIPPIVMGLSMIGAVVVHFRQPPSLPE
jgi:hypothetical protein